MTPHHSARPGPPPTEAPTVPMAPGSRSFFAYDSGTTPQHVALIATFVLPEDAGPRYLRDLLHRLRAAPAVRAPFTLRPTTTRLGARTALWQVLGEDEIDLRHHVRSTALPEPGGQLELDALVSRLHSRPLDPARPLWELHLVEGLKGRRFACYVKVHHALIDGVGFLLRLHHMLDPAHGDAVRPFWNLADEPDESLRGRTPGARANALRNLAGAARYLAKETRGPHDRALALPYAVPRTTFNGRIGRHRAVATTSCEFERIRAVARAAGATVNEVFLAMCGAGLRRYLKELGALPERTLTAGTPVSTRAPGDGSTPIAFTMALMGLGTDVADPVERVLLVARSSGLAKERARRLPEGAAAAYGTLFSVPALAQHLLGLGGRTRTPYNVVISNVPGPQETRQLCGARLESLGAVGSICHGMALFITAVSAAGRFSVVFTGDRDTVPRLGALARYTGEALAELEDALGCR